MVNAFSTPALDGHGTWSAPCCKCITSGGGGTLLTTGQVDGWTSETV